MSTSVNASLRGSCTASRFSALISLKIKESRRAGFRTWLPCVALLRLLAWLLAFLFTTSGSPGSPSICPARLAVNQSSWSDIDDSCLCSGFKNASDTLRQTGPLAVWMLMPRNGVPLHVSRTLTDLKASFVGRSVFFFLCSLHSAYSHSDLRTETHISILLQGSSRISIKPVLL